MAYEFQNTVPRSQYFIKTISGVNMSLFFTVISGIYLYFPGLKFRLLLWPIMYFGKENNPTRTETVGNEEVWVETMWKNSCFLCSGATQSVNDIRIH